MPDKNSMGQVRSYIVQPHHFFCPIREAIGPSLSVGKLAEIESFQEGIHRLINGDLPVETLALRFLLLQKSAPVKNSTHENNFWCLLLNEST